MKTTKTKENRYERFLCLSKEEKDKGNKDGPCGKRDSDFNGDD